MTFTLITISVTCFDTNTRIMADNDQYRLPIRLLVHHYRKVTHVPKKHYVNLPG